MRLRTRTLPVALLCAAFMLTGCSGDDTSVVAAPTSPEPSVSTSPGTGTPTPGDDTKDDSDDTFENLPYVEPSFDAERGTMNYCTDDPAFTGEAVEEFGADEVTTAYCDMLSYLLYDSFAWNSMQPIDGPEDVNEMTFQHAFGPLDPALLADVKKWISDLDPETKQGQDNFSYLFDLIPFSFRWFDEDGHYYSPDQDLPLTSGASWGAARAGVVTKDGEKRLALAFSTEVKIVLRQEKNEKVFLLPMRRDHVLNLRPSTAEDGPSWLITHYSTDYSYEDLIPADHLDDLAGQLEQY